MMPCSAFDTFLTPESKCRSHLTLSSCWDFEPFMLALHGNGNVLLPAINTGRDQQSNLKSQLFIFIKMEQFVVKTPAFSFCFLGAGYHWLPGTHPSVEAGFKPRVVLQLPPPKYWESHHVKSLCQTSQFLLLFPPLSSCHRGNATDSQLQVMLAHR